MAFQLSPGVNISEIDLTTTVPAVASSIGAIAGAFTWGPVNQITTISNEVELVNTFGKPDNDTATTFFSAANFLSYSGNLKVVRAIGNTALNASSGSTGFLVENEDDYTTNHSSGTTGTAWFAKYPGELGNSLLVSICDAQKFSTWTYKAEFNSAPGTSVYAASINPNANDEVHVIVVDEDGKFTGTPGTVLEKFAYVSKASDAKTESGESNYYKDVINRTSRYIWWGNHVGATAPGTAWGSAVPGSTGFATFGATGPYVNSLSFGVSANDLDGSTGFSITAYDKFVDDSNDVNLIIAGEADQATVTHLISNIAEVRKDCIVLYSPEKSDVVNTSTPLTNVTGFMTTLSPNSSYAVMDSNWKYQYDKYNDLFRWIPCNGDVAGLCARTDQTNDPWFSPAGYNRGVIKNVIKLAWNPSKAQRDELYKVGVNPIITESGTGTVLFGDKTTLARPSAFDRINVRRLFIILEKAIATAAKFSLFEINDEFTRAQFVGLVEPYLRDVQGRRGIYDFKVVCDETNNTPQVIDSNSFVGDIYIKPARSINYIQLNFVAVRNSVEFSEIVGQF
jgi:hypothetical protein